MYNGYKKLVVWQKAPEVSLSIYKLTATFPKHELYSLSQQLRRAAISVPCNIVEGRARGSRNEYARFLLIARGSLEEAKYQMLLAKDLGYVPSDTHDSIQNNKDDVGRLLNGLIKKIKEPS